jgi:glycosyltransferase 2 family protein|tara:strand:+ start:193 stop:1107 length:915 start_codon:yes stop_codon:yes gene_type:complete
MGKSKILKTFNLAVILLSFWFIGEKFWAHHNWLRSTAINYELFITIFVCSIIYGLSEFLLSFAWRRLLMWCGHKDIPANVCNKIYGKSQIAKYIPGNIFHFMGRHLLGSQAGVKHIVLAGATIYEILGLLSMSALISLTGMFIFGLGSIYLSLYQIILILLTITVVSGLVIALAPYLMSLRGIILPYHGIWDRIRNISTIYLFYLIFFLIAGLLLAIIVNIFLEINFIITTKLVVIFSIAWMAGFIVPGAPGGIGVREAVIIFFITPIIGEAQGVAIAIALRFITLLGDVWFLIISDREFYLKK